MQDPDLHGRIHPDITEPFVLKDGRLAVPTGAGIGVDPLPDVMSGMTVAIEEIAVNA